MAYNNIQTSALIKEFEINGMKFQVYNVYSKTGYPYFYVYTLVNGKWQLELERQATYPEMAWGDLLTFIKHRATAKERLEKFLENL